MQEGWAVRAVRIEAPAARHSGRGEGRMTRNWRRRILSTALFVITVVLAAAFLTWTMSAGTLWLLEAMLRNPLP
jgi:hypothetical protein